jgi:hypothetical protein
MDIFSFFLCVCITSMHLTIPQAITSQLSQQFEETRNLAADMVHMALNYGISKGVVQQTGVKDVYSVHTGAAAQGPSLRGGTQEPGRTARMFQGRIPAKSRRSEAHNVSRAANCVKYLRLHVIPHGRKVFVFNWISDVEISVSSGR